MTRTRIAALACALLASACGAPPVSNSLDKYVCPADGGPCVLEAQFGTISGEVVYQGPRRGDAVLLLFSTSALPPPDGTATSAVEVERVPSATLFAGAAAGSNGPFAAPFLFTEVPPGTYQIRAFLDLGGDFSPFADFQQSPHAGAPTGGTVSFDAQGTPSLASFTVAANQSVHEQVILGQEVPFDPPAFVLAAGSATSFPQSIDRPQQLTLQSFNPDVPHASFADPKFTLQLKPGADGQPVESDHDGLIDVYPQVNLVELTALQSDGSSVAVAAGSGAIVPCKVNPISEWPRLIANPAAQIGVTQLPILIEPFAVKLDARGNPTPLPQIPAGTYELVVAERTGQIWTLPNSLGSQASDSGFYVASQAAAISFTATPQPGGSISGVVQYPPGYTPHNLIVQAFAGGTALAPPLTASVPTRVFSLPAQFDAAAFDAHDGQMAFTLAGLPPGSYVVEAIDDADGNFNNVDILQTATRGDLVGAIVNPGTGALQTVTVGSAAITGQTVTLSATPLPLDPPAFVFDPASATSIAQDAKSTVHVVVDAKPDPFPALDQAAQTTAFTVALVRDAAGNPVDSDGDGLPDVWPRAFLAQIDPTDPQGLALLSPQIAIPVAVDPTPFLPALLAGAANLTLPATQLKLIVRPAAVSLANPAAPARLPNMPAGKYKLILMNETGQLWQVPNSSGSAALDPAAAALTDTASQSAAFQVTTPTDTVYPGVIAGTATVSGLHATDVVHAVYVFAYDVANPPPPVGTGQPVSADIHLGSELTPANGNLEVAYRLADLKPGASYIVIAIADLRGDFAIDPQLFAAAPGPGDLVGGTASATVTIDPATLQADAAVLIAASAGTTEPARPSFVIGAANAPATSDLTTLFPDALTPQRITISAATELDSQVVALAPETDGTAFFPVEFQGCDALGAPIDADYDNLPDLYPRVLVVRLDDSDPSGLTVDPAGIAIPAAVDPVPVYDALANCATHNVVPKTELSVILSPIAVSYVNGQLSQQPIPAGRYGVVLESKSGQVWRLPNELQPALLDPRAAATSAGQRLATQGVGIRVAAQVPAAKPGALEGTVQLLHEQTYGNLLVAAYDADDPPPPLGTGRPVAVQLIPRVEVAALAALNSGVIPYELGNLAPGDYLVVALHDPQGQLSTSLDFLSTPPLGGQLAIAGAAGPTPIAVQNGAAAVPAIILDATSPLDVIPFPRPQFTEAVSGTLSASAEPGTFVLAQLTSDNLLPGVPYPEGTDLPGFHPIIVRDATGALERDPNSATCGGTVPFLTEQVYATPIDTGSDLVAFVNLNSCQFCAYVDASADCSGAPLAAPQTMPGPLTVAVTNVAIDPATRAPAGVALPPGHYALTLVEGTGQSWTVPNQLAEDPQASSQAAVITVTP